MNRKPVPEWTGEFMGRLHTHRVTQQEIADAMECSRQYVTMILNGWRTPIGAKGMLEEALLRVLEERKRKENNNGKVQHQTPSP